MLPRKRVKIEAKDYKETPKFSSALLTLASGIQTHYGLCVLGPASSGKSSLLQLFSQKHSKTLLRVYMDSSIDSKNLIGTYVCGEVPGEFIWRSGILTEAVLSGSWIVFENLDRMSEDILSLLDNLIKTNTLEIPNKQESISPSPGFKLFATATELKACSGCWIPIRIPEISFEDLWEISPIPSVRNRENLRETLVDLHKNLCAVPGRNLLASDWVKFSRRAEYYIKLIYGSNKNGIGAGVLTENCRELLFLAAMAVYSGTRDHLKCIESIARDLGLNPVCAGALYENRAIPISNTENTLRIGISPALPITHLSDCGFALNSYSLKLLENLCCAVGFSEAVLLVGETGCGKTTLVQYLAKYSNTKLYVHNLSQMSDAADIVGGFKPVSLSSIVMPIVTRYFQVVNKICDLKANPEAVSAVKAVLGKQKWEKVLQVLSGVLMEIEKNVGNSKEKEDEIRELSELVRDARRKMKNSQFAFQFVEGSLVRALKEGSWVLLEEINLAEAEVLERLHSVLEGSGLTLIEKAEIHAITPHPNFRIFGCMNPGRQVGKKELPITLRSKFTEMWVPEMEKFEDIFEVVKFYLEGRTDRKTMENIVAFYLEMRKLSRDGMIEDGSGRAPQYSMRTLCRALKYALEFSAHYSFGHSLYNGIKVFFETPLTVTLELQLSKLSPVPCHPLSSLSKTHINVCGYYHDKGPKPCFQDPYFIITPSVQENLTSLSRAVLYSNNAILLEGPTSSGKTSMIKYLSGLLGHEFVRINNHEHTDIEEYIGSYVSDNQGRLVFCEGPLVTAVRNGYYLVLDELNLAPSEVLEALNRLLDDNRELFITETQTLVKPHPNFRLFATQNPTAYAGRKELSKAFRNRFVEMFIPELPDNELIKILEIKGKLAPSYSLVLISIMRDLQRHRQQTRAFLGKQGFITIRDLLKIARREPVGYQDLANYTYMLLAERLRTHEEKALVSEIISRHCKKVKIDIQAYYDSYFSVHYKGGCENIVWNRHMKRLFCLVNTCVANNEPVLLIGETGCGKTSICQALAVHNQSRLKILNCHQHTETSDFLGSLRPVRNRGTLRADLLRELQLAYPELVSESVEEYYESLKKSSNAELIERFRGCMKLFEWVDGPLVEAFTRGEYFLVDEISLADDSVLERLNSVLELERKLLIPEKAGEGHVEMEAHQGFLMFATMNPGGDYGKKELSPALRNRFTEIWVSITIEDIKDVLDSRMSDPAELVEFVKSYNQSARVPISLRDALACADFISSREIPHSLWEGLSLILPNTPSLDNPLICYKIHQDASQFGIPPFFIPSKNPSAISYSFSGPTVLLNLYNLLRGMQLNKAILLEGAPGVGKTSIIEALGRVVGHKVIRVNLSEETDLIDLLGCDLPAGDKFQWCDGVLLDAIKQGHWLILDELNLCPQQVIEGLNALLDHRATVFIPEINMEVHCAPGFRLFAAQNPVSQGGGRKGLPKSFLNRFTKIYMNELTKEDYLEIIAELYPEKPITNIVNFNKAMREEIEGPWEFNLRDMLRYCEGGDILMLYYYRLRSDLQRAKMLDFYAAHFGECLAIPPVPFFHISPQEVLIGDLVFPTSSLVTSLELVPSQLNVLREACKVVQKAWPLLLVGKKGCGKNSIVRLASDLYRKKLVEYTLSPNTDSAQLLGSFEQSPEGKFQWFESGLVKAMCAGNWVLLKNCNKCPAAVLDRINSLLEPQGKLLINERGLVGGESYTVTPHSEFRIIFTYNPTLGEVSRALRNRCVEIYVHDQYSWNDCNRIFQVSRKEYEVIALQGIYDIGKCRELAGIVGRKKAFEIVYGVDCSFDMEIALGTSGKSLQDMLKDPLQGYWEEDLGFLQGKYGKTEAKECFASNSSAADIIQRAEFLTSPQLLQVFASIQSRFPANSYLPIINLSDNLNNYLQVSLSVQNFPHDLSDLADLKHFWLLNKCEKAHSRFKHSKKLPHPYHSPACIDLGLLKSWKCRLGTEVNTFQGLQLLLPKILSPFEFSQIVSGRSKAILSSNRAIITVIEENNEELQIGIVASKESYQSEERIFLEEVYEVYEQVLFRHLIECMDRGCSYDLPLHFYPRSYLQAVAILQNSHNAYRQIVEPLLKTPATPPIDFFEVYKKMQSSSILDAPKYWFIGSNMLVWPRPAVSYELPKAYIELLSEELVKYAETDEIIQRFMENGMKSIGLGLWLYKLYRKINTDPSGLYYDLKLDYENIILLVKENLNIREEYHELRFGWKWTNAVHGFYNEVVQEFAGRLERISKKLVPRNFAVVDFLKEVDMLPGYSR